MQEAYTEQAMKVSSFLLPQMGSKEAQGRLVWLYMLLVIRWGGKSPYQAMIAFW